MIKRTTDILIIGGGPAGISAGIYACQDKTNFILIEEKKSCWFMEESINSHYFVEGFTGIKTKTSGSDLQKSFVEHYKRLGGRFLKEKVLSLEKKSGGFVAITDKSHVYAKAAILASGAKPKDLPIDNIDKFRNNIHFYCTIDGKKYIGKNVIVIGGRNSGAVAACYLHDLGCSPTLLELQEALPAKEKYQKRLKERNVPVLTFAELIALQGGRKLSKAIIKLVDQNKILKIPTEGVFVYIGRQANIDFIKEKLSTDKSGYLLVDSLGHTSLEGLFAAGDITCRLKQTITACGDGANAYYYAKKYIQDRVK